MKKGQPLNGNVAKNTLIDCPPFILSRDIMINSGKDGGAAYVKATAIQECMVGPLRAGNEILGCLNITSLKSGHFTDNHIALYKSVCEQLGIAIWNIISNEEIIKQEQEKSTLLSLSESMSKVRTRKGLWDLITKSIKPIFNFEDAVIIQIDWIKLEYSAMVFTSPEYRSGEKFAWITTQSVLLENTAYQYVVEKITKEGPSVFSTAKLGQSFHNDEVVSVLVNFGISETLFSPLFNGDRLMGTINFHYGKGAGFDPGKLSLIKSLSDLVSLSLANILANEEILEREREKTVLLKISNQLSLVNDRKELWALVSKTLKEILHFDVGIVATLDPGGETFRILLSTAPKDMDNNPEYKELGIKPELLAGSPFEYIFKKEGVFEFAITELEGKYPEYMGLKMMRQYGLLHTVGIRLSKGDEFIGQMYFHFNKQEYIDSGKFGLLKSIGEQMSIVVANILANEKIKEREKEKSLQIEVVNAITSTKHKTPAFLNLAAVINKVIPFHTFSIAFPFDIHYLIGFKKNKKGKLVEWHNVPEIMEYANIDENEYLNMLNEIAASSYFSTAHICVGKDHEDLCKNFKISALHNELIGTRSALHLPFLFHGQNEMVHIYLNSQDEYGFTEKDLALLQTIVSPLSLAMENLFAFEDIERREREKTTLLNLINPKLSLGFKSDR